MTQDHISGSWYNPRWREEEEIQTKSMSEMENKELSILERDLYDLLTEEMHILKDENCNFSDSLDSSWQSKNCYHAREKENRTRKLEEEQNLIRKDREIKILITKISELEINNTQLVSDVKSLREELEKTKFNLQDNGDRGERYVRKRLVLTSEFHAKTMEDHDEKTRLRKEISRLQQDKDKVMGELNTVTSRLMHQNSDTIKLREENVQLKRKNMDLKEERVKAKFQWKQMEIKQMDVHDELREREQELQKNVYDSKTEISWLQMDKSLEKGLTCEKERKEVNKLKGEQEERQASLSSKWTEEKVNNDKQIRELRIQNQVLKQELKQQEYLSKKNEEKSASKVKEQEREIESLNKAVSVLRRKVNDRQNEKDLTDLNGQSQRLLQENKQLITEKKSAKEREIELQSMNRKLQNTVSKQKQEIKELEEKMKSLTLKTQQHFTDFETSSEAAQKRELELQSINRNLQNTIDKQKQEINKLDCKIQSLTKEKQNFGYRETSVQAVQKGENDLKCMNISLQTAVHKQRKEIAGLNDKMQQLLREKQLAQKRETENESLKTKLQNQNKEMVSLKVQVEELSRRLQETDRKPSHKGFDDQGQQRLDDANKRLLAPQEELEGTKSRMNPEVGLNVAELSDKNRPTKVSERYMELFENQRSDAFQTVHDKFGTDDKQTIEILRDIFLRTMSFCKKEAENHMRQITTAVCKGQEIPPHYMRQLKSVRKALAELYEAELLQKYKKQVVADNSEHTWIICQIPDYVDECLKICWQMAVQDPPMALGPEIPNGGSFDKKYYERYTHDEDTGTYIVWPVILLHEGGPVLHKGVAQGQIV